MLDTLRPVGRWTERLIYLPGLDIPLDFADEDSPLEQISKRSDEEVALLLRNLGPNLAKMLLTSWGGQARRKQRLPEDQFIDERDPQSVVAQNWQTWLLLGGRGMGKTRTGAETTRTAVARLPAGSRIALIAPTARDARDTMVEGESGMLAVCSKDPDGARPRYYPTRSRIVWPNGTLAAIFSAEEPERLRGPQFHFAWADELAAWKYLDDAWDNLQFGLRLGENPRVVVTTTPKPLKLIKDLYLEALKLGTRSSVFLTTGSSFENLQNLSRRYRRIISRYVGTRLGRQEIYAEILSDVPGALWTQDTISEHRVHREDVPDLVRIVTAVDPAASAEEGSNETGIVRVGRGVDGHAYILTDATVVLSPAGWARQALDCHYGELDGSKTYGPGDAVVGEVNNGGDMVEHTIRTDPRGRGVRFIEVRATRGKVRRAEPIAGLYEQGRVHHAGYFPLLEDQMIAITADGYQGSGSPDRLDALVWALTELFRRELEGTENEPEEAAVFRRGSYHAT